MLGCDYSAARPSEAEFSAARIGFVGRYVSTPGNSKNISAHEAALHRAAGRDIVAVFETTGRRMMGGSDLGASDAALADLQVLGAAGPPHSVIFYAADWDVQPAEMDRVLGYLRAAGAARGVQRTGVYGGRAVVDAAVKAGLVGYIWQTRAWSWDPVARQVRWHPNAHIRQYSIDAPIVPGGTNVDMNEAMTADFGQWGGQDILAGMTADQLTELVEKAVDAVLVRRRAQGRDTPVEALDRVRAAVDTAGAANVAATTALAASQRVELRTVDLKNRTGVLAEALKRVAGRVGAEVGDINLDFPPEG